MCRGRVFDSVEDDEGQYNDIREISWGSGAALFLNMNIIREVGYIDETFEAYAEELDLCWRIKLRGYKVLVVPDSVVYHLGSASWGKKEYEFRKEYLHHRNHWIPLFKNYSKKTWVRILPFRYFLDLLTLGGFLIKRPKKSFAVVLAQLWVLFNFVGLFKKNRWISSLRKVPDREIMTRMIKTSVALRYFLLGEGREFKDYVRYIEKY